MREKYKLRNNGLKKQVVNNIYNLIKLRDDRKVFINNKENISVTIYNVFILIHQSSTIHSILKKTLIFILIRYIKLRAMEITQVEWDRVSKDLNDLIVS